MNRRRRNAGVAGARPARNRMCEKSVRPSSRRSAAHAEGRRARDVAAAGEFGQYPSNASPARSQLDTVSCSVHSSSRRSRRDERVAAGGHPVPCASTSRISMSASAAPSTSRTVISGQRSPETKRATSTPVARRDWPDGAVGPHRRAGARRVSAALWSSVRTATRAPSWAAADSSDSITSAGTWRSLNRRRFI